MAKSKKTVAKMTKDEKKFKNHKNTKKVFICYLVTYAVVLVAKLVQKTCVSLLNAKI
jgi:hypothetical protein